MQWGRGGPGAAAAPHAGWAAKTAAARSPCPPGTAGSPVPTSSSAVGAWGMTRPVGLPKVMQDPLLALHCSGCHHLTIAALCQGWPNCSPIPSAQTSGIPGAELGCSSQRSHPGRYGAMTPLHTLSPTPRRTPVSSYKANTLLPTIIFPQTSSHLPISCSFFRLTQVAAACRGQPWSRRLQRDRRVCVECWGDTAHGHPQCDGYGVQGAR